MEQKIPFRVERNSEFHTGWKRLFLGPESNNMNPEKEDLIMMCLAQFKSGWNLIPFRDEILSYNS